MKQILTLTNGSHYFTIENVDLSSVSYIRYYNSFALLKMLKYIVNKEVGIFPASLLYYLFNFIDNNLEIPLSSIVTP